MKKIILAVVLVALSSSAFAQNYNFWYKLDKTTGSTNQTSTGTTTTPTTPVKSDWETFADAKGLSKDWANLPWGNKGLTTLPNPPYPVTTATDISLYQNSLTNVDGLRGLTTVTGSLNFYVGSFTNMNGLVDVTFVGGNISVRNNNITDITGIRNIQVKGIINIDKSYSGPKMDASSRFCTLNAASQFSSTYAPKTTVCK